MLHPDDECEAHIVLHDYHLHLAPASYTLEFGNLFHGNKVLGKLTIYLNSYLITYLLTHSIHREAKQSLQPVKKFPTFLWNPMVLYRTQKYQPPVPILSRLYPVPTNHSNFLKIDLNPLAPSDPYMGRTAQLTSRYCILNIYSTYIHTEYFNRAA
jgi:hypothetical protein